MKTKFTVIKWESGVPYEEGRYLVQIYSGGIDIDYYDIERGWDNYMKGDVLRWTKLSELEDELNRDPLEKYKGSMNTFSLCMENASKALREYNKEVSKINMEELNDD